MNSPKIQIKLIMKTEDVAVLNRLASKEGMNLKTYIKRVLNDLAAKFLLGNNKECFAFGRKGEVNAHVWKRCK